LREYPKGLKLPSGEKIEIDFAWNEKGLTEVRLGRTVLSVESKEPLPMNTLELSCVAWPEIVLESLTIELASKIPMR
jgi:hypothetical protein